MRKLPTYFAKTKRPHEPTNNWLKTILIILSTLISVHHYGCWLSGGFPITGRSLLSKILSFRLSSSFLHSQAPLSLRSQPPTQNFPFVLFSSSIIYISFKSIYSAPIFSSSPHIIRAVEKKMCAIKCDFYTTVLQANKQIYLSALQFHHKPITHNFALTCRQQYTLE